MKKHLNHGKRIACELLIIKVTRHFITLMTANKSLDKMPVH